MNDSWEACYTKSMELPPSSDCLENEGENTLCSTQSKKSDNQNITVENPNQNNVTEVRRTPSTKYSTRLKKSLGLLRSVLPVTGQTHSSQRVIHETLLITTQMEEELSHLLANKRRESGSAIYNSAPFTLSHARASYVRFLREAEKKIKSTSELEQYLVDNVEGAASKFFTSLAQSCTYIQPVVSSGCTDTTATQVSSETGTVDCFELANGLECSAVTIPQMHNGLSTPKQNEERPRSPSTPVSVMRPRKQRCIPTPSTTPASSHTKDATSTLAHKKQKLHSPASKKCLTFADVPFHLPEHSGKDDQMQSQGMKQGNFVSDSANCKLLTVHSGRKSRSLSSSKSSVYNADRSRKTCHSQSSASKKEEPLPKQLQHSPTLRNTNEELNKDSYYLTACSEYADSNTHNLNFKEGENRSLKRSHSDLGLNTINCIKTKIFHVSNDHQHSNIAANFPTSEVYDNFNQPSKDEGVESTTSGNSQSTYITSNILYKRAGNFSTEQQGFFNFLSENGEKQSLPFLCGTEICTPPRYPRKSLPFSSPSDFLTKFAPADTYKLSGTSSAENPLSQEDCKIPDHLQGSAKSGIETNLSDLSLLPSKIGISTGVDEDPVCNEDFKELCEYKFQEKSYLGYYTNIPVQRPPNVIQQLHTLALKTDTPKQPPASVQSALPLQLETASIKSHMLDKQPNVISIQYNREGNSFRCGQQISVNRQLPLNDLSQDLQPGTTNPLVEIPIRSYLRSPNPLVSQNLELGTSEVGTPKPALKVNVAFSPTETLECFETESFITPVGRHYILPVEAPRKTLHPTTRQHPPRCRRSLARLFDEKDACVTPVADTPPDTPNRSVEDPLPEMESDGEM